MAITALETRYAGCRFRSRLEARWAVFFDALNIKWEYEPEGYTVGPSKRPYLPDFRLSELHMLVEVKGDAERLDVNLLAELTRSNSENPLTLVLGPVPTISIGKVPTHSLFMPSFDFPLRNEPSIVPTVNAAFAALEKLDDSDRRAVRDLISRERRMHVSCYRAPFFPSNGRNWSLMPIGMPIYDWTPEQVLNPGTIWQVIPHPRLAKAYEAARSARFEHGEQG